MIINSLLDSDFYKFSMQQIVFHRFSNVNVEYEFKIRNYPKDVLYNLKVDIMKEIEHLCTLKFTEEELLYLKNLDYFTDDYINFLKHFQLNENDFSIYFTNDVEFNLRIKGSWLNTILFETPVLAIISEIFCENLAKEDKVLLFGIGNFIEKKEMIKDTNIKFIDFGTRRRFSFDWQKHIISEFLETTSKNFIGTSNLYFAKKYNLKPYGTFAHEFVQAMQSIVRPANSQRYALQQWADEYRGQLGIALSDTLGMDKFFKDFDLYFAKLYDGVRQDSGNPYKFGDKLIDHYLRHKIHPYTKTIVFSDGLTFPIMIRLNEYFKNKIKTIFGIGTNLTNDVGIRAPQIVIKMTKCNGRRVAKISDSPGKQMCNDENYLKYLRSVI